LKRAHHVSIFVLAFGACLAGTVLALQEIEQYKQDQKHQRAIVDRLMGYMVNGDALNFAKLDRGLIPTWNVIGAKYGVIGRESDDGFRLFTSITMEGHRADGRVVDALVLGFGTCVNLALMRKAFGEPTISVYNFADVPSPQYFTYSFPGYGLSVATYVSCAESVDIWRDEKTR